MQQISRKQIRKYVEKQKLRNEIRIYIVERIYRKKIEFIVFQTEEYFQNDFYKNWLKFLTKKIKHTIFTLVIPRTIGINIEYGMYIPACIYYTAVTIFSLFHYQIMNSQALYFKIIKILSLKKNFAKINCYVSSIYISFLKSFCYLFEGF